MPLHVDSSSVAAGQTISVSWTPQTTFWKLNGDIWYAKDYARLTCDGGALHQINGGIEMAQTTGSLAAYWTAPAVTSFTSCTISVDVHSVIEILSDPNLGPPETMERMPPTVNECAVIMVTPTEFVDGGSSNDGDNGGSGGSGSNEEVCTICGEDPCVCDADSGGEDTEEGQDGEAP